MEFPRLGQHCNESSCKQLDFLPMKCDACSKIFCRDHIVYATHYCSESYKKNNQIPVCPLCNLPCPIKKGELPDSVVEKHIESTCSSDPAEGRRKVYTNKCSKKGCKKKELVPVTCAACRRNFCFGHRHGQDHACRGFEGTGKAVSNAGAAALLRAQQTKKISSLQAAPSSCQSQAAKTINSDSTKVGIGADFSSLQVSLNEEEELVMALQMSLKESAEQDSDQTDSTKNQEREDYLLAQALAASEQDMSGLRQRRLLGVKA